MMIKCLYLKNFRNYSEIRASFSPRVNTIYGENAQGKTSLLEALYLFIIGRSFRTSHVHELIRFGTPAFCAEILFEKNGIEQTLHLSFDGKNKTLLHNATPLQNMGMLLGMLNGVVLSPEDRGFLKEGPVVRRNFLDLLLSQAKPLYLHHLCRYLRAMKQRNVALKKGALNTLSIWEEQMALSAAHITRCRAEVIKELAALSQQERLDAAPFELLYHSKAYRAVGTEESELVRYFQEQFLRLRTRESILGLTLSGPHRDDVILNLEGQDARLYASEGQQRSCIASIKLAQWKWLYKRTDHPPLFCIDDLSISFDAKREEALLRKTEGMSQVFITTTRFEGLRGNLVHISNGKVISL